MRVASAGNALAGIWLVGSPFTLDYGATDPYWNDMVFGAAITLLALARVTWASNAPELSWINAAMGAWVLASAFWLDDTSTARTNDMITGALVLALATVSARASEVAWEHADEAPDTWPGGRP